MFSYYTYCPSCNVFKTTRGIKREDQTCSNCHNAAYAVKDNFKAMYDRSKTLRSFKKRLLEDGVNQRYRSILERIKDA